ncbi:MAG: 50S ribosomal protein L9 [Rhizobiaceae bacterium]|nr:50S ribosomal protein L9 [Rhizobiaceae bacterium]
MDVILLERIAKLGQMGDVVSVKPGYARNFLLPQGKALRANDANRAKFEADRANLEARNAERKDAAEKVKADLDGNTYVLIRSAGQTGQLYGSVSSRDIAATLAEAGFTVARNQVNLMNPIKVIGLHEILLNLHPEVDSTITVNVARSEDEAERQAAGEDLTGRDEQFEHEATDFEADDVDLSEVFDNPDDVELGEGEASDEAPAEEAASEEEENS